MDMKAIYLGNIVGNYLSLEKSSYKQSELKYLINFRNINQMRF